MKKLFLFLFILTSSFKLFAQTPLEWQKINLEEKLTSKVKTSLGKILEDNQYVIESEVTIMDPGLPNFDDMSKVGLKVSDIPFDSSRGDYIAFSKVGLEVPVVEKYFNDNQQKLKELHRFNESYNVFKNIEKVDVKVWLSDQLSPELVTQAETMVRNLKLKVGDIAAQVSFEKMSLETPPVEAPPVPKDEGLTLKDILKFISEFGNAFGLIAATLLFGFIAYKLLKLWEEIMQRLNPKAEPKDELEAKEEEEEAEEKLDDAVSTDLSELDEILNSPDFERFRIFFEKNPKNAVQLIKKWIRELDTNSQLALKAVAQQLSDDELIKVFENLEMDMRSTWKYTLDHFLSADEINEANKFISEEVVRSIIEPSQVKDHELVDIILSLTDDMATSYILEEKEHGKVLMNLLTPQFSGKILDGLDDNKASEIIQESLSFDFKQIKDSFASFKQNLKNFVEENKRKPFGEKILQMLPDFNPLKEKMLYEFLAKNKMKTEIHRMACENLPSELISRLPGVALKAIMQAYEKVDRAMLLLSLEGATKDHFMNSFAEEGSALREMLQFDFEEVQNDPTLMARVENKQDDLWKQFVMFTRSELKKTKDFNSEVDALVTLWMEELLSSYSNTNSTSRAA